MKFLRVILVALLLFLAPRAFAQRWTFVQESHITYCTNTASSCTSSAGTIVPTVANSVRVVSIWTSANVTITSVTGGGSSWTLCPNCHTRTTGGDNVDMAYTTGGGTSGQTVFTVNLSGGAGGLFLFWFTEFLPPTGSTASLDASGSTTTGSTNCATCSLVGLTLTGTDVVYQQRIGAKPVPWHAFSAPYVMTQAQNALALNTNSGTAPTMTASGTEVAGAAALAFKSSAGTFAPPAQNIVPKNVTATPEAGGLACTPTCSLTIPSTTAGNLLYLQSFTTTGSMISSVTDSQGDTWVAPAQGSGTGSTCQSHATLSSTNMALGCAYALAAKGGTTSVSITLSGGGQNPASFVLVELGPTGGTFALDAGSAPQGSTLNAASLTSSGQSLTLASGADDAIFQALAIPGGSSGASYFPQFCLNGGTSCPNGGTFQDFNAMLGYLGDATGATPMQWVNQQNNSTLATGIAFRRLPASGSCAGGGTHTLTDTNAVTVKNCLLSITAGTTNTVILPAGTSATWAANAVNWSQNANLTLQGQTNCTNVGAQLPTCTDSTVLVMSDNSLQINAQANGLLTIKGITLQNASGVQTFNGAIQIFGPSSAQVRVTNVHFNQVNAVAMQIDGPVGVADHNWFYGGATQNPGTFNGIRINNDSWNGANWGDGSWADSSKFGTSGFFFFENNTITHMFLNDCQHGGRQVIRYNYFNSASMQGHEMNGRWTGCRAWEVYKNTWFTNETPGNDAIAMLFRTGTGLVWGNSSNQTQTFINLNNDRSNTQHLFGPTGLSACVAADGSFSCWGMQCNTGATTTGTPTAYTYCNPGGAATLPNAPSIFDGNTNVWGYPGCQQVGTGKQPFQFPNNDFNTATFWNTVHTPCNGAQEPMYVWANTGGGNLNIGSGYFGGGGVPSQIGTVFVAGRDYCADAASGGSCVTSGASNPVGACTAFQGYWNTTTNTFFQCQGTAWVSFYTPYTYPHPLAGGGGGIPSTPSITPAGGTYPTTQSVTLASTGTAICYTTDGSTPTASAGTCTHGTTYSTAISVTGTGTTINALGTSSSGNSAVASATYTLQGAAPTFSPPAGNYAATQNVTINQAQSQAKCYTTDGSTPTSTGAGSCLHGTLYSTPISIAVTTTLNAIGMANGFTDSAVATAMYTIAPKAATPTSSPAPGTYASTQSVTLSVTGGAPVICYTTNNTNPATNGAAGCTAGTLYTGAISVSVTTTIRAIAGGTAFQDSNILSALYTIVPTAMIPTFTPGTGTYTSSQSVTITTASSGAIICYTNDNSTPVTNGAAGCTHGTLYSGPVTVSVATTLKAVAGGTGYTDSGVGAASYSFRAATPTASPLPGTYSSSQNITLATTAGPVMCYTLDGTTPQTNGAAGCTHGTLYATPIAVTTSETILAVAGGTGFVDSTVGSFAYVINAIAATPTFSPPAGTYNGTQSVTITSTTAGAIKCYTTNGSAPATNGSTGCSAGSLYSSPVTVSASLTLKAVAGGTGLTDSVIGSAAYTIQTALAAPQFSPAAGNYSSPQSVTITSTTGATICFTNDGSTPTTNGSGTCTHGTTYSGAISVSTSQTLTAIATKSGSVDSTVTSAQYFITIVAPTPVASPPPGTYATTQSVQLSVPVAPTLTPTVTDAFTPNSNPLNPANWTTMGGFCALQALGGFVEASTTTSTCGSVSTATFPSNQYMSLSLANYANISGDGLSLEIRADGLGFDNSYDLTILSPGNPTTLDAYIFVAGVETLVNDQGTGRGNPITLHPNDVFTLAAVGSQIFWMQNGNVVFQTHDTTYASGKEDIVIDAVNISDVQGANFAGGTASGGFGGVICYTVNGTNPQTNGASGCTNGTLYSGPISVATTTTIRAVAGGSGLTDSPVAVFTYTITTAAAAPALNPSTGTYTTAQHVTMTTASVGAHICYTSNGSTPSTNGAAGCTVGTLYSGAVTVSSTTTLMAVAGGTGYTDSPVTTAVYTFRAGTPTGTPPPGTYASTQNVALSTTAGGVICYSTTTTPQTNGTTGCTVGTQYTTPISVSTSQTIFAVAGGTGFSDSAVASLAYVISNVAATPVFNPPAGTYSTPQNVTITTTSPGAILCVTTSGATPATNGVAGCTTGFLYTGPVPVASTLQLRAIAGGTGYVDSAVNFGVYTITSPLLTPTFSPPAGNYGVAQSVVLTSTAGATICYTVDGSTPTTNGSGTCTHGTTYSAAIAVPSSRTIKAIATKSGSTDSAVASAQYIITTQASTPTASPPPGTYATTQNILLGTASAAAIICYTTDGSMPADDHVAGCITGTLYGGSFPVSVTTTVNAIAGGAGFTDSSIATFLYVINTVALAPAISPGTGVYQGTQTISISDGSVNAVICYTTNGSTPSTNGTTGCTVGTLYSATFTVSAPGVVTVKAIAGGTGFTDGPVTSAAFSFQAATPVAIPGAGSYSATQTVALSTSAGGVICYSTTLVPQTNGAAGCTVGTLYSGTISVGVTENLNAVAGGTGYVDSPVALFAYSIGATPPAAPLMQLFL
jgi:hypothetical protein